MIIGGCGFSTAGGLKIFRLIHLFNIKKFIRKSKTLTENNKKEIITSLILLLLLPSIPFVVALHLSSLGNDFYDSYFEAIGAITTAGIGTGIINIDLDTFTKILVSFLMILGRLEVLVLIYIFLPKLM
jgi:trk system potassium uptake protein TrkH